MSTKHTPGPWVWNGEPGTGCDLKSAHGDVLNYFDYEGMSFGRYNGEDAANARLMAAAPDLLWALRNLSAIVDAAILSGDWKVDGACDPDMDIAAARAAIAKARGDA